ncbi:hypothetical protein MKUB_41110 [Mycobacterium kubicae]|uniref:Uncharacterized protein n=1 Tax=Mycobacterium kubicae TaxID=120959 RepID=A0ABQ1BSF6_9MYCO|nr:hypothetical protein MKUB_41110 [Mycobacterium kubicae]
MAGARHAEHDAAVSAHDGDGLLKLLSLFGFEFAEPVSDLVDQAADAADFLLGGHRLDAGPVIEVGGGEQAFPVRSRSSR